MNDVGQVLRWLVESKSMSAAAAQRQLTEWREETGDSNQSSGEDLLAWLVHRRVISRFQVEALCAGHTGPLTFGPFRVQDRLAIGRLGTAYRAVHEELQQPISLKVFPASTRHDPERSARMERELLAGIELEHPNVVRMYQTGQVGGIPYLAFEDLRGETLQDRLNREGALDCATACMLVCDAARGLAAFHDKFLVHRDVQPGNMWISEGGRLKIMELGAVRRAFSGLDGLEEATVTTRGTVLGMYDYMAPEQAQNAHAAEHRSDIYSLGCVFYHCLTGHPPFAAKNPLDQMRQHANEPPVPVVNLAPGICREVGEIVGAMLAKSPDDRLQSMEDVVHAVEPHAALAPEVDGEAGVPLEFLTWARDPASSVHPGRAMSFVAWLAEDSVPR
jgi:eukaryotic-like serine/threonine-protein kinase